CWPRGHLSRNSQPPFPFSPVMAEPQIETALNESRILVLGTEVLVGAEFTAVFQSSFAKLPALSQGLVVGALALLLLALALVMSPTAFHQLAEHGRPTPALNRYVTRIISLALFPFALS